MTDAATLEVAEMVLCGLVNKEIASLVKQAGARAVGICGKVGAGGGVDCDFGKAGFWGVCVCVWWMYIYMCVYVYIYCPSIYFWSVYHIK